MAVRGMHGCVGADEPRREDRSWDGHHAREGTMTQATTDEPLAETVAQRAALVQVLELLSAAEWDPRSLCAGWRIREAVAHITMPFRYSTAKVLLATLRARGRFNVATDQLARADYVRLSPDELLGSLRANVAESRCPPSPEWSGRPPHRYLRTPFFPGWTTDPS
jgi:hypothetical protein